MAIANIGSRLKFIIKRGRLGCDRMIVRFKTSLKPLSTVFLLYHSGLLRILKNWKNYQLSSSQTNFIKHGYIEYTSQVWKINIREGAIKNGQFRETGNIGYTRHRMNTNKTKNTTQKTKNSNTNPIKNWGMIS